MPTSSKHTVSGLGEACQLLFPCNPQCPKDRLLSPHGSHLPQAVLTLGLMMVTPSPFFLPSGLGTRTHSWVFAASPVLSYCLIPSRRTHLSQSSTREGDPAPWGHCQREACLGSAGLSLCGLKPSPHVVPPPQSGLHLATAPTYKARLSPGQYLQLRLSPSLHLPIEPGSHLVTTCRSCSHLVATYSRALRHCQ